MNKISLLDYKKIISKNYYFFIITILVSYIYFPIILKAGLIADDWAIYELKLLDYKYYETIKSWFVGSHYSRPVALAIIGSIGFIFGQKIWLYHLFDSSLWIISVLIFGFIFKKLLNDKIFLIFIILSLTPIFSSSNIFSPAEQVQGTASNFLASISFLFMYFYYLEKKFYKLILSYIFLMLALLTYETAIVFVPLLIFLQNKFQIKIFNLLKYNLKKIIYIFFPIILFIFLVFFYQTFMKNLLDFFQLIDNESGVYKFQLFEKDFLQNLIKYAYKPITLITHDILKIYFKSIHFVLNNKLSFIFLIIVTFFIFFVLNHQLKINRKNLSNFNYFDFYIIILISYLLVILIHIAGTALPTVSGYANRGLCSFSIIFSIFFALFFDSILEKSKNKSKLPILILILSFVFLHMNSFIIHRDNYLKTRVTQNDILTKLVDLYKLEKVGGQSIVFANIPTFQKKDFNKELIFSTEVHDWPRAIYHESDKMINSERIFVDKFCKNILNYKEKNFEGLRPSRSRKVNKKVHYKFFSKYPREVKISNLNNTYLYIYIDENNYKFEKFDKKNINEKLKKIFNCI